MFVLTVLAYPAALVALCAGAGLLVDRAGGGWLPAPLLLTVGAAALISLSQLSTLWSWLAPATPYLMAALAMAGAALSIERLRALAGAARRTPWPALAALAAYAVALAPVLAAGRATFSSYMALADSAVHMMGADYLIRHGQEYAHLDLRNSYGQFINDYYNSGYPSGADTLFGGAARLLGVPLIWCFQPFNAFMLAIATGPAWMLCRRARLGGALAALASALIVLGALDYAYELLASVKEVTALAMLLTLACLTVDHERWLYGPARRAPAFALVVAAGISALGVAFGAWALVAAAVLAVALLLRFGRDRGGAARALPAIGLGAAVLAVAAWPTWRHLSGSLRVAQAIASTSNSGNLHTPLRAEQVLGVWLRGSYKLSPAGASLAATRVLEALVLAAALLGAAQLLRARAYALAGWVAGMLLAWLLVSHAVTTWAGAKTLMLTAPAVMLLAWAGVGVLAAARGGAPARAAAAVLALAIAGGALASDALQYRSSNLAPTARYEELSSIDSRYAGMGPALFTDFDEYAMYELRDLDVGGPDFVYYPPALAGVAGGYGYPVVLDRARPAALASYPLIVTRRDPSISRPPAAYTLVWEGSYYEVWRRFASARVALAHVALTGSPARRCAQIGALAARAGAGDTLTLALAPEIARVQLLPARRPRRWGREREGLVMSTAGTLAARFALGAAGMWDLWVKGQLMPRVAVAIDGRAIAHIGGELGGNSLVLDTAPAIGVRLSAGAHTLEVTRGGVTLAPGDGGSAVLGAAFLTPASTPAQAPLRSAPARAWRTLCGAESEWAELTRG